MLLDSLLPSLDLITNPLATDGKVILMLEEHIYV